MAACGSVLISLYQRLNLRSGVGGSGYCSVSNAESTLDTIWKGGIAAGNVITQTLSMVIVSSSLTFLFVHRVCTLVTVGRRWKSKTVNGMPW
ncbi:hypothetical protein KIPE111705_46650 [Kibdelosporangium persicum]